MRTNAIPVMVVLGLLSGLGLMAQSSKSADQTSTSAASAADQKAPVKEPKAWPVSFVDTAMPSVRVSTPGRLTFMLLLGNVSADAQPVTFAVQLRSSSGATLATQVTCTVGEKGGTTDQSSACRTDLPAKTPVVPVTFTVTSGNTP